VDVVPGLLRLEDTCLNPLNTHADGPVFGSYLLNAMWRNLELQATSGRPAPHGGRMRLVDGAVARDGFGNAIGGIRLPELDLPVATYLPNNVVDVDAIPPLFQPFIVLLDLFCRLSGSVFPFDEATLAGLYPSRSRYLDRYEQKLHVLVQRRFLLPEDAEKLRQAAAEDLP